MSINTNTINKTFGKAALVATLLFASAYSSNLYAANLCDKYKHEVTAPAKKTFTANIKKLKQTLAIVNKQIKKHGTKKKIKVNNKTTTLGLYRDALKKSIANSRHSIKKVPEKERKQCNLERGYYYWNMEIVKKYGFIGKVGNWGEMITDIPLEPILKLFGADGANNDVRKALKFVTNPVILADKAIITPAKKGGEKLHGHVKKGAKKVNHAIKKVFPW